MRIDDIPASLTATAFWELFGRLEHETLEFKRGAPNTLLNAIPAMAMTHGGLIILGVRDDREITGCRLSQKTQDRVTKFADECNVEVQLRSVAVDGVECVVIAVPPVTGRIVTTPDGRLLRRVGGDNRPLRGDAHVRFVRQHLNLSAEEQTARGFTVDELDLVVLNQVMESDQRPAVTRDEAIRTLVDLGVAATRPAPLAPRVMSAAAVLFSNDLRRFIPRAAVQLVCREGVGPGPGRISKRHEVSAPLSDAVDRCLDFIDANTDHYDVLRSVRRIRQPEYPPTVLREMLVNALAHRDYWLVGATIDVTIWRDRIEVKSPGSLPGHVTVENMRTEHYSRNPRIMRVLKTMGVVEEYGDGISRMFDVTAAEHMEPPSFVATDASVTVTLRNKRLMSLEDQAWLSQLDSTDLTVDEQRMLIAIRDSGSLARRDLKRLLVGTNTDTLIAGALAKRLVNRIGVGGGTRYALSSGVIGRAGSRLGQRQRIVLDHIDRVGHLSTREAADLLDVGMSTARQILAELKQSGVLVSQGRTRALKYYRA